jgi:hypothetical protein
LSQNLGMRESYKSEARGTVEQKSHLCVPFLGIARLSPNFHIHVSVSDLHIPRIVPHFSCSRIGRSIVGGDI